MAWSDAPFAPNRLVPGYRRRLPVAGKVVLDVAAIGGAALSLVLLFYLSSHVPPHDVRAYLRGGSGGDRRTAGLHDRC